MTTSLRRATLAALLLLPFGTRGDYAKGEDGEEDYIPPPAAPADPAPAPKPAPPPAPSAPVQPVPAALPLSPLETLYYRCRYVKGDALKDILDTLTTPRGRVVFSEALHTLVISDEAGQFPLLNKSLEQLDRAQPQVQVEARVVEVTLDSDLEKEMNLVLAKTGKNGMAVIQGGFETLGTPGANPNPTQGTRLDIRAWANADRTDTLDGFIRLLLTQNKAKILSSPNIVVDLDSEASIITGEEVPIQTVNAAGGTTSTSTTFKRVGIKLKVTPMQISDDMVRLAVAPEVSSVTGFTNPGSTPGAVSNPIVAVRNTRTVLSLKDGQTLIIGGLKRAENRHLTRKVPLLGDIPLLGGLFRSERDQAISTMLMFYLRVRILKDGAAPAPDGIDSPELRKTEEEEERKTETSHEAGRKKIPW